VPDVARVPYVDADNAPPATAKALTRLPGLNVFGLLAHAETAFVPWLRFGGAVLSGLALDPLLRELTILQVGRLAARYEWDQHVPIARACGATDEQIAALDAGETGHACFTPAQRAVLAFVADMVRDGEVPDDTYAALAAELDDRRVVEVALTAGHYLGLARIMTALRIDPDQAAPLGSLKAST
jgi:alkylhydroperoxidase family enzyme